MKTLCGFPVNFNALNPEIDQNRCHSNLTLIIGCLSFTIIKIKYEGTDRGESRMNEKHIQQVLKIEKQAQEMQEKAKRDAKEIPVKAEQEAQEMLARARSEAQEEARKLIAQVQSEDKSKDVATDVDTKNSEFEALAKKNFDKAVEFVLNRVIGKA
jgi:V/A-type H+-transporting ATPase subunit G/H